MRSILLLAFQQINAYNVDLNPTVFKTDDEVGLFGFSFAGLFNTHNAFQFS